MVSLVPSAIMRAVSFPRSDKWESNERVRRGERKREGRERGPHEYVSMIEIKIFERKSVSKSVCGYVREYDYIVASR